MAKSTKTSEKKKRREKSLENTGKQPWEIYSDLLLGRLLFIANIIIEIRGGVILLYDPESGDTPFALGVRCYERCRKLLIDLAESGEYPWLQILEKSGRFTLLIGKVPVRFVRSDPRRIPPGKRIIAGSTVRQLSLFNIEPTREPRLFFVIDAPVDSAGQDVYFVGLTSEGEIVHQYKIPLDTVAPPLTLIDPDGPDSDGPKPVPQQEPDVRVKIKKKVAVKRNE